MGLWDVLAAIATLAQLSGVHAVMLIALAARLLRIPQCETECDNLERCARRLYALLDMAKQHPAVAGLVAGVLAEAAGLLASYRGSTLWCRVRTGGSMETQLRDMQTRLDCLCALVLCVHANLLTAAALDPSDDARNHHASDPSHGAEASDASDNQRRDSIGQGGEADDQPDKKEPRAGSESV